MSEDDSAYASGMVDPNAAADDDNMNDLTSSSDSDSDEEEERQQQRQNTVLFPGTLGSSIFIWTLCIGYPRMNLKV